MTREEAMEQLQNCIDLIKQDGQDYLDDRDIPLLDMAIKALQREDIFLKSMETEDDYFERTPIEKQRVCCNCSNRRTSEIVSKCMIDGHYIGYAQCFTNGCRHWASDELKWIGGDNK
jgi:hypothetical protein